MTCSTKLVFVIGIPDIDQIHGWRSYLLVTIDSDEVVSLVLVTAVSPVISVDTNGVPVSIAVAETTKNPI